MKQSMKAIKSNNFVPIRYKLSILHKLNTQFKFATLTNQSTLVHPTITELILETLDSR